VIRFAYIIPIGGSQFSSEFLSDRNRVGNIFDTARQKSIISRSTSAGENFIDGFAGVDTYDFESATRLFQLETNLTTPLKVLGQNVLGGDDGAAPHKLLSATHTDTVAASVVQGDIIIGDITPKWSKLAIGTALQQLRVNAGATALEYFTDNLGTVTGTGATNQVTFWTSASNISGNANFKIDPATGHIAVGTGSAGASRGILFEETSSTANMVGIRSFITSTSIASTEISAMQGIIKFTGGSDSSADFIGVRGDAITAGTTGTAPLMKIFDAVTSIAGSGVVRILVAYNCRAGGITSGKLDDAYGFRVETTWGDNATKIFPISIETTKGYSRFAKAKAGFIIGALTAPAASAVLELKSTTGAFLPSRMTKTQRNSLTAVNGMILYNSSSNQVESYQDSHWTILDSRTIYSINKAGTLGTVANEVQDWRIEASEDLRVIELEATVKVAPDGSTLIVRLQHGTTDIGSVTIADGAFSGTTSVDIDVLVGAVITLDITTSNATAENVLVRMICDKTNI